MEKKQMTIGVLTSGGDAPGMNAAIRSVVRAAIFHNMRVLGVRRGYSGLISGDIFEMHIRSVKDIIQKGGTMLFSARSEEFMTPEGFAKAVKNCKDEGMDGLIVIGGDGSFRGASKLSEAGIPCIGIPGTIDNDIPCSDYTIGFDTAVNTAIELVDKIRDTSQSHDRCSIVEVMGRNSGHIALHAGISCGASAILVPEIEFDIEKDVAQKILASIKSGKQHFVIVASEGVGDTLEIAKKLEEIIGIETRCTVLGHVQRGGAPTYTDRLLASMMGHYAVTLLQQGKSDRVVVQKNNKIVDYDITEALSMTKPFECDLYNLADEISN